jgi:hypothetical protein
MNANSFLDSGALPQQKIKQSLPIQRKLLDYTQNKPGPLLLLIAGMHGNEPAGVNALQSFATFLQKHRPAVRGRIVGIIGNIKALELGKRYLDTDLNRVWGYKGKKFQFRGEPHWAERQEFTAIVDILEPLLQKTWEEVVFIDLHTTSAQGAPFLLIGDTIRNRRFVQPFPTPKILGLEEQLNGPLLSAINEWGYLSIGFEAGQHEDPASEENHLAFCKLVAVRAGNIAQENIPDYEAAYRILSSRSEPFKKVYEIRFRYGIKAKEIFEMLPGFLNFQPIEKGQLLACNQWSKITAQEKGCIFMPLYQPQGNDGFFIIQPIPPFWLKVSYVLRKINLIRWIALLPGVYARQNESYLLNTQIARFLGVELFHLLGFRQIRKRKKYIWLKKRPYDLTQPPT